MLLTLQEVQGGFVLQTKLKGVPVPLPIFQDFLLLSNHSPVKFDECY